MERAHDMAEECTPCLVLMRSPLTSYILAPVSVRYGHLWTRLVVDELNANYCGHFKGELLYEMLVMIFLCYKPNKILII